MKIKKIEIVEDYKKMTYYRKFGSPKLFPSQAFKMLQDYDRICDTLANSGYPNSSTQTKMERKKEAMEMYMDNLKKKAALYQKK